MNCWKSYNILKDLGSVRLVILSTFGTVSFFVLCNLLFTDLFGTLKADDFNMVLFLCSLLLVYPLHKFLHCLPLWLGGKKAKLTLYQDSKIPKLFCEIDGAVPKRLYMIVILFPLLFMTTVLCVLTIHFPNGIHYYSIMGSINFGLSVSDLLYFTYLFSAPRHAIIEDDRDGCRILLKQYF